MLNARTRIYLRVVLKSTEEKPPEHERHLLRDAEGVGENEAVAARSAGGLAPAPSFVLAAPTGVPGHQQLQLLGIPGADPGATVGALALDQGAALDPHISCSCSGSLASWSLIVLVERGRNTPSQVARVVAWFDASLFDERRAIAYIWDSSARVGTIIRDRGPHAERALVVVRSGPSGLGAWHRETRNVYQDYRDIFRDEPAQLLGVTLESHSDDVASQSAVLFDRVRFQARYCANGRGRLDLMGPAVEPPIPVVSMPRRGDPGDRGLAIFCVSSRMNEKKSESQVTSVTP